MVGFCYILGSDFIGVGMVYTDGNLLIADSEKELHHAAHAMGISHSMSSVIDQ